jgi:hypothetical protein
MLNKIIVVLCSFLIACANAANQPVLSQCSVLAPGEIGIASNTPDAIRLIPVTLSTSAVSGYIATEYIGAPNLQASIYVLQNGKYSFSGDLGSFTGYSVDPYSHGSHGYFDLIVKSRSGGTEFIRRFRFEKDLYRQISCTAQTEEAEDSCVP